VRSFEERGRIATVRDVSMMYSCSDVNIVVCDRHVVIVDLSCCGLSCMQGKAVCGW